MDGSPAIDTHGFKLDASRKPRIAIIGSGFSGIGMAINLKRAGYDNFVILERAAGLGGTWRDNDYPGAACDVPVRLYSFSFAQNPNWSRAFGEQPEILDYLKRCAAEQALMPHFRFNADFAAAAWDDSGKFWRITLADGRTLDAEFLVGAWGGLTNPALPAICGIGGFSGPVFHSARWRHDVDLAGKRVAVIGTGASAIQFAPRIAGTVAQLDIFQRTPPWIIPKLDREITSAEKQLYRALPFARHLARAGVYAQMEVRALGFVVNPRIMRVAQKLAQKHLARSISDPTLRDELTPSYTMGCKRVLISNDWYPMFNRANVSLITNQIDQIEATGIRTNDGILHQADAIILGTGFQVNDYALPFTITGRNGADLAALWETDGPSAYLGTTIPAFPNLFMLMGPNTGLGHNSMIYMIESQIAYVMRAFDALRTRNASALDVKQSRHQTYNDEIQGRMKHTVWTSGCSSWYATRQGRVTAIWPGFTFQFRKRTSKLDPADYEFL